MHPEGLQYIFCRKGTLLKCGLCFNLFLDHMGNMDNKGHCTGETVQNDSEVSVVLS